MSTLDFSIIDKAGLTQGEFAEMLGVSRVTVNHWVNGAKPSPYLTKTCGALLQQLKAALEQQLLPGPLLEHPPNQFNKEERRAALNAALDRLNA